MLKKQYVIFSVILIVLVVSVSLYGAYTLFNSNPDVSPSPSASSSPDSSPTPTSSPTITSQPTSTTSPTSTPDSSPQPTSTPSPSTSITPTPTSTPSSTPIPTSTPTMTPTPSPTPTPKPTSVVIVDANGAQVNVTLPVNRIVCLTGAEMVYALDGGDKIVAISGMLTTDAKAVLPSSITSLPTVGQTDTAPNMELILELEPDLIIASQRLTDVNRQTLEAAGIAVIEDSSTGTRRNQFITNLGQILDAEEIADELISYEQNYRNLVTQRTANLTDNEKPTVFFEWYKAWFSSGPNGSYSLLIEAAGGINIAENATSSNPQLSSEFVIEANPDIVIRMLDYTSGENLTSFQALYDSIIARSGVSDLNAVSNNQVHVIKSTLLVERDIVGLLYFAKWFHPTLFADIDPAAVHAEFIQKFFGTTVEGVYLYP